MKRGLLKFLCLMVVLALAFGAVGCSGQQDKAQNDTQDKEVGSQPSNSGNDSQKGSDEEKKDEKIKITFHHQVLRKNVGKDGQSTAHFAAYDKFLEENPNIEIEEEAVHHDTYHTKIQTLSAANELPDVFMVKGSWFSNFHKNGLISPIDDLMDANPEWKNGFKKGSLDASIIDGKVYGAPQQMAVTHIIFYNEDILKECGIDEFPKTMKEFEDAVVRIREKGYIPFTMGNKGKWLAESCYLSALGDRYTGTEWMMDIINRTGKARFTDPEFVSALEEMQKLAKMGAFNSDLNSLDNDQQRSLYYNKEAAMFVEGVWAISRTVADAPEDVLKATKLTVFPAVESGKGDPNTTSGGSGWFFSVNSNIQPGAKRDAIGKLLEAITGDYFAKLFIENNGFPAYTPKEYDESKLADLTKQAHELFSTLKYTPIYDARLDASVIEVMNSGLQELLIDAISPQELAERIQAEYEKAGE